MSKNDLSEDLRDLLEQYREKMANLSEKEKALMERRIWTIAKLGQTSSRCCYFFMEHLGGTTAMYELRQRMISFGDWFDPLWIRIDSDMTPPTAVKLAQKARKIAATECMSNASALQRVLAEYDSDDMLPTILPNGKIVRKKRAKTKPPTEVTDDVKKFWALLETHASEFLDKCLDQTEPSIKQELRHDFIYQMRAVYDDWRKSINRERKNAKEMAKIRVGRDRIGFACERLGISVPKTGKPVADLDEAKKRYRVLAARYHPDLNKDPNIVKQFHAVNEAWDIVRAYQAQFGEQSNAPQTK